MNEEQKIDKIKEIRALIDRELYDEALITLLKNLNQLVESKEYRDEILSINEKYYDARDRFKLGFIDENKYEIELSIIKYMLRNVLNKTQPGRTAIKDLISNVDLPEGVFETGLEGKFGKSSITNTYTAIVSLKGKPTININVKKGDAPPEVIADLLSEISILYRKTGGSGINFSLQNIHIDQNVAADE